MKNDVILQVVDLKTYFKTDDRIVKAVDGVSFDLHKGETLGIVGESGCGKSVSNLSVIKLIPSPPGKIMGGKALLDGEDIFTMPGEEIRRLRGNRISMIFQDPYASLNPRMTAGDIIAEPMMVYARRGLLNMSKKEIQQNVEEIMEKVGLSRYFINRYPH